MKWNKGFTLIELMVIISIIGILLGIFIPNFVAYQERTSGTDVTIIKQHDEVDELIEQTENNSDELDRMENKVRSLKQQVKELTKQVEQNNNEYDPWGD